MLKCFAGYFLNPIFAVLSQNGGMVTTVEVETKLLGK
jgi:hypothetical protein